MRKYDLTEDAGMPDGENNNLAIQVAELRSDVRHIQSDVTDVKADMRVLREETRALSDRFEQKFETVNKEISAVKNSLWSAKIWALLLYFALAGSVLLVLARGFKWI